MTHNINWYSNPRHGEVVSDDVYWRRWCHFLLNVLLRFIITRFLSLCSLIRSDLDNTLTFLPRIVAIFLITFLMVGFITFSKMSAKGFASSAEVVATTAMEAVVTTVPAGGMALTI